MYERSLLTLRALTDRRTGAVAAGARDGWAYVWPRDAGAAALAFAAAGYRAEARRVARFLLGLDLGAAARFHGDGAPVPGARPRATPRAGSPSPPAPPASRSPASRSPGATAPTTRRATPATTSPTRSPPRHADGPMAASIGSVRSRAGGPGAARPATRTRASTRRRPGRCGRSRGRRSSRRRAAPCCAWPAGGPASGSPPARTGPAADPWTAPTAWTAWSLAALGRAARRAPRRALPRRPAPRRHPGRRPARAGRRPHRRPPLDHPARLVARLRDPRPARALALRPGADHGHLTQAPVGARRGGLPGTSKFVTGRPPPRLTAPPPSSAPSAPARPPCAAVR